MRTVHFRMRSRPAESARSRFVYEELLGIQLGILRTRAARLHEEKGNRHVIDGSALTALGTSLPFRLTIAQQRAIGDILADMASPRPMMRLLQGDVGSGKTVVALYASLLAVATTFCENLRGWARPPMSRGQAF
jgi:ATP-dependent DNA helicase RecG